MPCHPQSLGQNMPCVTGRGARRRFTKHTGLSATNFYLLDTPHGLRDSGPEFFGVHVHDCGGGKNHAQTFEPKPHPNHQPSQDTISNVVNGVLTGSWVMTDLKIKVCQNADPPTNN